MIKKRVSVGILTVRMQKGYGVDVVVDIQASVLCRLGYYVTVYTMDYDENYYADRPYKIIELPDPSMKVVRYLKNSGHDIIIAHTTPFFEVLPLLSSHVITICYEHGDPFPFLFPEEERLTRQRIKDNKRIHVYPNVHVVIAISQFIRKDIDWQSAQVIYNGGDHLIGHLSDRYIDTDVPDRQAFARKYGLDGNKRYILCVSRLGRGESNYKGIDEFIDFVRGFQEKNTHEFIVLGKGTLNDKKTIEQNGITVILNADRAELISAYRCCDMFMSCSKWEGFNLPLIEAQYFGKPVFAIDTACHKEVTPNVFRSFEEIRKKIEMMTTTEMETLGRDCEKFVSRFTWEANINSLENLMSGLLEQQSRVASTRHALRHEVRIFAYRIYFFLYNVLRKYPPVVKSYRKLVVTYVAFRNFLHRLEDRFRHRPKEAAQIQAVKEKIIPDSRPIIQNEIPYERGLVSICILTKDHLDLIKPCLESIEKFSSFENVEILIGDTGSTEEEVLDYYRSLPKSYRIYYYDHYHFSANNNALALEAKGEFLLFLNNDTSATRGWLEGLKKPFMFGNVAIVGPKLLFRNHLIQHAGAEIFTKEPYRYVGWHPYATFSENHPETNIFKSMPGVTGACMMIRHDPFNAAGGFDPSYQEECQDMDLCLRIKSMGYRVIYTPETCIYHYENMTRAIRESDHDRNLFKDRWKQYIDNVIFSGVTQSTEWKPYVCLTVNGSKNRDQRKMESLYKLIGFLPNIRLTIKAKDLAIAKGYADRLTSIQARCLHEDYEDNVRYDHMI
jgi:GT2 family glycosyltransferase/glycosyltransferase involved in cell wall biosynthesis